MKRALIILAIVLGLGAIVAASVLSGDRRKSTKVYGEQVETRDISQIVKCSGQIHPRVKVNISAHVIGKIEHLFVEEGQAIEAGAPFLELETESFVAVRDNARAQLAIETSRRKQAEIDLQDAELKLRRAQRLKDEGISTSEQLEAAEIAHRSAELQVERSGEAILQARANLDKVEDDLNKATIFSPLSGRVIELNAEEGEVVVSGTMNNAASVIGVVADLSEILAEVDVDETEIVYVELGQPVTILVDALADVEYTARVVEIGSSGFSRPQQPDVTFFKVKALLDEPDDRLRPGMSARAEIGITTHEEALVVPIQAVVNRLPLDEDGESLDDEEEIEVVFVVDENDEARQAPVETGIADATHIEILSGLDPDDTVVTGPYRTLKKLAEGELVKVRDEGDDEDRDDEDDD